MGWNPTKPTVVIMTSQQQQPTHHKARHRSEGEEVGFEWGKESRRKYCLWWGKWDSLVNRDNSNPHQVSLWPGQARELTPSISFVTIQFSLQSSPPSLNFPPRLIYPPVEDIWDLKYVWSLLFDIQSWFVSIIPVMSREGEHQKEYTRAFYKFHIYWRTRNTEILGDLRSIKLGRAPSVTRSTKTNLWKQ